MAERYSMLPTDVFKNASTHDLHIVNNANLIRTRQQKKANGESIADTYSQSELESIYKDFKDNYGNENKRQNIQKEDKKT